MICFFFSGYLFKDRKRSVTEEGNSNRKRRKCRKKKSVQEERVRDRNIKKYKM